MLDLFVAALMTVADPTVVAQAPTASAVAMSTQSKKPVPAQGYERTYTGCQDVQNLKPDSAHNDFSPLRGVMSVPKGMSLKDWAAKVNLKVTELEAPKHGTVKIMNSEWYSYTFIPDKDYVGKDRVVYEIEDEGKRYKVTINFWIVQVIWEPKGDELPYALCQDQKFNGSSIAPDSTIGGDGPPTNGTSNSVIGYTMGGIPFGKDIIRVDFADLPGDGVGQTIGNTITLDINAASHGWFIDKTPGINEEYVATSNPNEWIARVGSDAAGKMDLLTVLAHEVGHVYGLPHSSDSSLMSEDLKPGVRHTVSLDDLKALWARLSDSVSFNIDGPGTPFDPLPFVPSLFFGFNRLRLRGDVGQGISLPPLQNEPHTLVAIPAPIFSMTSQNATALHTDIFNGDFSVIDPTNDQFGWITRGRVNFDGTEAELVEDERLMSGLQQTFVLPAEFRTLRFTITGADFADNGVAPVDAFEMALIDAATGLSALGVTPLVNTDALINIQSDGTVYAAPAVSINGQAVTSGSQLTFANPVDVSIDLTVLAPGAVLTLYFDLLGLGAANSRVTIDNVQIVANLNTEPVAENDVAIVDEDSFISIPVLANDTDTENDPLTTFLVDAPQNGGVVQNLDGSFTYTPNANYFGTDSFTYRANDGEFDSNLATVDITVNPVNDAPVVADIITTTLEDTAVVVDLLASASDIDSALLTPVIVSGPVNGTLTQNADGTVAYTPNTNYFGDDSFTYKVRDEELDSNLATVSINVTPVNDAPQGADHTVIT